MFGQPLFVINRDVWNGIPSDLQKIMEEVSVDYVEYGLGQLDKQVRSLEADFRAAGVTFINLSDPEKEKAKALGAEPVWQEWAKSMDGHGYAGQELLELYMGLLRKYEQQEKTMMESG